MLRGLSVAAHELLGLRHGCDMVFGSHPGVPGTPAVHDESTRFKSDGAVYPASDVEPGRIAPSRGFTRPHVSGRARVHTKVGVRHAGLDERSAAHIPVRGGIPFFWALGRGCGPPNTHRIGSNHPESSNKNNGKAKATQSLARSTRPTKGGEKCSRLVATTTGNRTVGSQLWEGSNATTVKHLVCRRASKGGPSGLIWRQRQRQRQKKQKNTWCNNRESEEFR